MSILSQINLPAKIKADKLWELGNFEEAANQYYNAARYAAKKNDTPLSKKLYVEHHLALICTADGFSTNKISNLLTAINNLIDDGIDDRLKSKFESYTDFFEIIMEYNKGNYPKLEINKLILQEKQSEKSASEIDSLSLILIEVILAKHNLQIGRANQSTLSKLSTDLSIIIHESYLPTDLKRKLKEFAIKIGEANDPTEKKK